MKIHILLKLAIFGLVCHVTRAFVRRRNIIPIPSYLRVVAMTGGNKHDKRPAGTFPPMPFRRGNNRRCNDGRHIYSSLGTDDTTGMNHKTKVGNLSAGNTFQRFGNSLSFHGGLITLF